jgi:hypothetical protein
MELGFPHKNSIQSILKELSRQTEELLTLFSESDSSHRILPVSMSSNSEERSKIVQKLLEVRRNIEAMCKEFHIEFDSFRAEEHLLKTANYMFVVSVELLPKYLRGYGELSDDEQSLITAHAERIMKSIEDIYKTNASSK